MQWSPDSRLNIIIAGRLGFMRYPESRGRPIEHFDSLYTNRNRSILWRTPEDKGDHGGRLLPQL